MVLVSSVKSAEIASEHLDLAVNKSLTSIFIISTEQPHLVTALLASTYSATRFNLQCTSSVQFSFISMNDCLSTLSRIKRVIL
jgi:hypothetical protein